MNDIYTRLSRVPQDALRTISAGKLKGKSDINPQWRYEALTDIFGLCGEGWKYEITNTQTIPVPSTGELMIFVSLNLYYKTKDGWSEAIPGHGGDFLIVKDKNGIHGNDEALKMAVTDALGTAAKMIGVAASVYRGKFDGKYTKQSSYEPNSQPRTTSREDGQPKKQQQPAQQESQAYSKNKLMLAIVSMTRKSKELNDKAGIWIEELGYRSINDMSVEDMKVLKGRLENEAAEQNTAH